MIKPALFLIFLLLAISSIGNAQSDPRQLLIVELQTEDSLSASNEFVEIYNPGNGPIPTEGWRLQYKSSSGTKWTTKATFENVIDSRSWYLFSTYQEASQSINPGISSSGGHIRIIDELDHVVDLLGWGTATDPETLASATHTVGQSLKRATNEDGQFIDSNDNSQDFFISDSPTPNFDEIRSIPTPIDSPTELPPTPSSSGDASPILPLQITELFIDPEQPLTDKEDEFVEIYNPNSQAVLLSSYQITTGIEGRYKYELPAIELQPNKYIALFSIDTGLTLSNKEGKAELLTLSESKIFETEVYENAKSGQSWSFINSQWGWASPTPGKENSLSYEKVELNDRSSLIPAVDITDEESQSETSREVFEDPPENNETVINKSILAGVGSLAVLYAGYEYRYDFRNRITQFREYIRNRRQNRS